MPSHARTDTSPAAPPWGGVAARARALPWDTLDVLGRLAVTVPAADRAELAGAWISKAAQRLPVAALHLALRENGETRLWSSPSDAPIGSNWRRVEDAIDTGESSISPLGESQPPLLVRVVVPIISRSQAVGALVADTPPAASGEVLSALEALRWPLGLRSASLTAAPHDAVAAHALCTGIHRHETLTALLSHLLSALPGLLGADWAAVATFDPQGRVLHVTTLEGPDPLGPEGWLNAVRALDPSTGPAGPRCREVVGRGTAPAWVIPLRAHKSALHYVLAVGGGTDRALRSAQPLLEVVAGHAEVSLARIVAAGELRLALDAHTRVMRITQLVTSLNQGQSPAEVLDAVMRAVLQEVPGLTAGSFHLWTKDEFAHEQSAGEVPPCLRHGAGLAWWQERMCESLASRLPRYWPLPEGCDDDALLITIPIVAGASDDRVLGMVSLFATGLDTVDLVLRTTLSPFSHIIAQLVQTLQHYRALERANRELELRKAQITESKGALEAILEGFPDGLFIVDRDLRVTLSNDVQALRAQGSEPVAGQFCWELFGCGGGVCPGCRIMDTLKRGISTRRRMRVRRPGQSEREWEVATHPIARRSARSTQAALVVVRDVTEQEQMAKSLAQVEKLAAVGRLAGGIGHEINNPLAAIQANVQLLLSGSPDPEQVESLEIMRRATERARRVVRNLLSFSEQSIGHLAPVDVNATIHTALDLVSHQCRQGGVMLECRLGEGLPPVMASQEQIESVWLNLALNALDAVLEGGVAGRIEVTSEATPRGQVRVVFRDNGPGIPPSRLPHVFEPFGGSSVSPAVGTGLGLFSCHNIVKRHGGTIRAGAGEGGGSRFEVLLPALVDDGDGLADALDDVLTAPAGAASGASEG